MPVHRVFPAQHPELWKTPLEGLTRKLTPEGYVNLRVIPGQWEPEHRMVLAQMLGRPLRKGETAHHRNGIRTDNRPENLELWVSRQRSGQRASEIICCPNCGHGLHLIAS